MKKLSLVLIVAVLSLVVASVSFAGDMAKDVTLEGDIICAKCAMKTEGMQDCQNVLVVKKEDAEKHYYLTKNDVYKSYGDVCMKRKTVTVTGTVAEKDGQKWLTASKIEPKEKKS